MPNPGSMEHRRWMVGILLITVVYIGLWVPLGHLTYAIFEFTRTTGFANRFGLQTLFIFGFYLGICEFIAHQFGFKASPDLLPIRIPDVIGAVGLAVAVVILKEASSWAMTGHTRFQLNAALLTHVPSNQINELALGFLRFSWDGLWGTLFTACILIRLVFAPTLDLGVKPVLALLVFSGVQLLAKSGLFFEYWQTFDARRGAVIFATGLISFLLTGSVYLHNRKWTTVLAGLALAVLLEYVLMRVATGQMPAIKIDLSSR